MQSTSFSTTSTTPVTPAHRTFSYKLTHMLQAKPNTTPKYVAILPDFAKNAQTGSAPIRACPCNPDPTGFCFPTNIMKFFSDPLNCNVRIFSRFPGGVNMYAPYIRTTLAWADRVAADLYISLLTSSFALQAFIHNTPSSSASYGPKN